MMNKVYIVTEGSYSDRLSGRDLTDNYQQFQKNYQLYKENLEKFGFWYKPSDDELFGIPYRND